MKKALLIATRHVQAKPDSKFSGLANLPFAHRDAKKLHDFMIESHGYRSEDIVLMIDDPDHPSDLWPTRPNILHQIDLLTEDAPEDSHFFFYFSGHGLEEEGNDRACMRADGRDGEIVCADGKPILDYILNERLIKPLENVKGSTLFALFDCCHSENLLDLQKGDRPNNYSRVWTMGADQLFKCVVKVIANFLSLSKKCRDKYQNVPRPPRRASTKWRSPPASETRVVGELSVICLSACRDGQLAHDDIERELTFTKCFMDAIASKPHLKWTELRDMLKELVSDIQERYEETCLQESLVGSESKESLGYWTQEPRLPCGPDQIRDIVTETYLWTLTPKIPSVERLREGGVPRRTQNRML